MKLRTVFREFLKALGLGVIIFIVLYLIALAGGTPFGWNPNLIRQFFFIMLYTVMLHMGNMVVFIVMDKIFHGVRMSAKRLLTGFLSSFIVSVLIVLLLRIFEDVYIQDKTLPQFFTEEHISNYYVPMIITLVFTFSLHLFYFYKQYQENRVKQQKIIAGTASAKFETLKNQIDPHFLFNSLNVLSSLIEENPDAAQKFTTSLSKVYRYVLEQKDKELVSVEEELSFAKTYMNLLKMRFENSVFYELPIKVSSLDARVVPLSLQLLLENTVKHNIVSEQKPLHIRIFEEDGYLVVQNDFQKKEVLQDRKGVGLQNIVSRYAIITARRVKIEQTEKHFAVKLPVLTKQVTIMETTYNTQSDEQSNYYKAQKKVEEIKGFYGNLFSYIVVITGLAILNLYTGAEHLWFFYPAMGWGLGVAIHAMSVFNFMPFLGSGWEERKIKELLERERNNKWK
ncbi:histidine kinase [Flavobacterium zepuense]|uniref:Histidine kinase n=1 Tax=Flavobacterium zepuense TaxID=2593302 RepID=A0A552UXX7_9FLAO|nr:2TM domain-containing protein [Flavobacterium zepuense]TRW23059.1 histidine kinase [Flavobacterium zepuense]